MPNQDMEQVIIGGETFIPKNLKQKHIACGARVKRYTKF